jgi:hypothetical protein
VRRLPARCRPIDMTAALARPRPAPAESIRTLGSIRVGARVWSITHILLFRPEDNPMLSPRAPWNFEVFDHTSSLFRRWAEQGIFVLGLPGIKLGPVLFPHSLVRGSSPRSCCSRGSGARSNNCSRFALGYWISFQLPPRTTRWFPCSSRGQAGRPDRHRPEGPRHGLTCPPSHVGYGTVIEPWVGYRNRQSQRAAPVDDDHSAGAVAFWEGATVSRTSELIVLFVGLVLALAWLAYSVRKVVESIRDVYRRKAAREQ